MSNMQDLSTIVIVLALGLVEVALYCMSQAYRRYANSWADYQRTGVYFYRILMLAVGAVIVILAKAV